MMSDLRIVLTTAVSAICLHSLTLHGDSSLYVSCAVMTSNTTITAQQQNSSQATRNKLASKCGFANINVFHTSTESETEQIITETSYLCKYM
jgi:hypothetical protein